jgi:YidC/Oxa1 family membrane protein insertase
MDKRWFLVLFLTLGVIGLTQVLFPPPKKPAAAAVPAAVASRVPAVMVDTSHREIVPRPDSLAAASAARHEQRATVDADVDSAKVTYTFSNVGAAPVSIVMRGYANRSIVGGLVDLAAPNSRLLSYSIVLPGDTIPLENVVFDQRLAHSADGSSVLTYFADVRGHAVSIAYTLGKRGYAFHVSGALSSTAGATGPAFLLISLPTTLRSAEADTTTDQRNLAYVFKRANDRPGSVLFGKLDPGESRLETGPLNWVAVKNKYFVLGILADRSPFSEVSFTGGARTSKIATHASAVVVQSVQQGAFSYDVYAGPQEMRRLAAMGNDFDHVNPYGWKFLQPVVHPVASLVIRLLLWMHNVLRLSYGWVLVILGIAVRLILWPLYQSTMRSTLKMQVVQPKIAAAQKRYKDDPKKQQEAIMRVYQEEGISPLAPLAGCLPALLPMPVFFALFFVFQNTIEFRGVPFLWLHDLSTKDPLYIIPFLMGCSMFLLSWIGMRNSPPNPQAKMMGYVFPVMMTVVLANLASGLNLYYTAQNLANLPQQWLIARERLRAKPPT